MASAARSTVPGSLLTRASSSAHTGWAKACYGSMGTFNMGATYFVQPPPPGNFTPNQLIDALHRYPIETLCCPPTIYRSLVSSSAKAYWKANPPRALNHCVGAGEPLNASVIKEFRDLTGGLEVKDGYGQSARRSSVSATGRVSRCVRYPFPSDCEKVGATCEGQD